MKRLALLCGVFLTAVGGGGRAAGAPGLSLTDARARALGSHPRTVTAEWRARAAREGVTEVRAALFPTLSASATAADNDGAPNTRLASGSLNNPSVYERAAVGASLTQLITDFGRTPGLTEAARLRARAAATNVDLARAQLLVEVDGAFFSALSTRAVRTVAARALDQRLRLLEQVRTLATNQLRSELDVRFAEAGVDEARLLQNRVERDWEAARGTLASLVGEPDPAAVEPADGDFPRDLPEEISALVTESLGRRPDLVRQRLEVAAARRFATAERALHYPTVSAYAAAGVVPLHDSHFDHEYAAAGLVLNLPLFAGGLPEARRREAEALASAAESALREAELNAARDVRLAWIDAREARERETLSERLQQSTAAALALAQARYDQGLTTIIELQQAQLNRDTAEVARVIAGYDFLRRRDLLEYQTGRLH